MSDVSPRLQFDDFELDEGNAPLTRAGQAVQLPPKAFALLCTLTRQPGRLTKKDALLDAVWGHRHVSESVLKTTVSQLRAALADSAGEPRYIETVSRHGYRFIGTVTTLEVAAMPVRVTAHALVKNSVTAIPASTAPLSFNPTPIVGRIDELARLHAAWQRAQGGARQLMWVVGEAGVGKSTLIRRFADDLPTDALIVGQCVEHFGTGEPYLPLLEALRELCERDPELPALMRAIAPTWILQMPWLIGEADRALLQRDLAGTHPERMVRELRELLSRVTAKRPLVLILEDLHWSDVGTLRMMEHFARQPGGMKLLWIASFRLTQVIAEDHPLRELRQELRLHRLCEELQLDPFSEREVNAYLESRLPNAQVAESFVRRLHEHTEGLPLFVANVTDALLEQAMFDAADMELLRGDASAPLPVPDNLSGVIEKQIKRLPAEVQRMLEAASVCGAEFRAATVAALMDREPQWLSQQCDELAGRGLWLRHSGIVELPDGGFDSRYAFLHAVYQHVCYQRIPASQRVQHHRRMAASIAARRDAGEEVAVAELASHCERGHETVAALRAYAAAAQGALGHFAPREAEYLASRGLELLGRLPEGVARMELELELVRPAGVAASLLYGVASEQACVHYERGQQLCETLPPTPERAVSLSGLGWVSYVRGDFDAALALANRLQDIAARFDNTVLSIFAFNIIGVSLIGKGDFRQGCAALECGIALCQQLGDKVPRAAFIIDPQVSMQLNLAIPLVDCGLVDQGREHLKDGLQRAERIGQPIALMLAHWTGGMVNVRLNNPDKVAEHAAALAKVVQANMLPQGEGPSLWLRGWAEAQRGDPKTGHAHILQGYACHARLGMYAGCPEALSYAVEALILAGDWQAAQQQLDDTLRLAERIGERVISSNAHLLGARIAQARNDMAAARDQVNAALRLAREQQALGLELNALIALAELEKPSKQTLNELRAAYKGMTEGLDTWRYRRAGELLGVGG